MITRETVEQVIEQKVRPILRTHGGDISLIELKDNNIKVRFLGACSSCPSVKNTMEEIVVGSLRQEFGEEIDHIELWDSVSDDLLGFARNYFKNKKINN